MSYAGHRSKLYMRIAYWVLPIPCLVLIYVLWPIAGEQSGARVGTVFAAVAFLGAWLAKTMVAHRTRCRMCGEWDVAEKVSDEVIVDKRFETKEPYRAEISGRESRTSVRDDRYGDLDQHISEAEWETRYRRHRWRAEHVRVTMCHRGQPEHTWVEKLPSRTVSDEPSLPTDIRNSADAN
jgi:hypothetical protein